MITTTDWAAAPAVFDCLSVPPPPGPNTETDEEFQRRVDELLAYRTPWWRDAAAVFAIAGTLMLALAAGLWAIG